MSEIELNTKAISELKELDEKIVKFLNSQNFNVIKTGSFILIAPFLAPLSFKLSLFFGKIDNYLCKFFPGFLLYAIVKNN